MYNQQPCSNWNTLLQIFNRGVKWVKIMCIFVYLWKYQIEVKFNSRLNNIKLINKTPFILSMAILMSFYFVSSTDRNKLIYDCINLEFFVPASNYTMMTILQNKIIFMINEYVNYFHFNEYVNKQNCCCWSLVNPHVILKKPLHSLQVTVWCSLWSRDFTAQYLFEDTDIANGDIYDNRFFCSLSS